MPTPSFRQSPRVISQSIGEQLLLLHLDSEEYYSLDEVGVIFWNALTEEAFPGGVVQQLVTRIDADESTLLKDAEEFVAQLLAIGLVVESNVGNE